MKLLVINKPKKLAIQFYLLHLFSSFSDDINHKMSYEIIMFTQN